MLFHINLCSCVGRFSFKLTLSPDLDLFAFHLNMTCSNSTPLLSQIENLYSWCIAVARDECGTITPLVAVSTTAGALEKLARRSNEIANLINTRLWLDKLLFLLDLMTECVWTLISRSRKCKTKKNWDADWIQRSLLFNSVWINAILSLLTALENAFTGI